MGDPPLAAWGGFAGRIGRKQYGARMILILLSIGLVRLIASALVILSTGSPRYAITTLDG